VPLNIRLPSLRPKHSQEEDTLTLRDRERIVTEGAAGRPVTAFGGRLGRLILTNQRLIWLQSSISAWPFRPETIDIPLSDILEVKSAGRVEHLLVGSAIKIRTKTGKKERFVYADSNLGELMDRLNALLHEGSS
jgi:hypothetical protein